MRSPLAIVAALLDRLGRYEAAAVIAGFALSPLSVEVIPELDTAIAHLRDVLSDQTYEQLAHKGEAMTTAAMATFAYREIDGIGRIAFGPVPVLHFMRRCRTRHRPGVPPLPGSSRGWRRCRRSSN
jgi:hypothetical protein